MQPLALVSQVHELLFAFDFGVTAKQKSRESEHVSDDAKRRLDRLFTQPLS
jgi:hypothetical protein